MCPDGPNFTWNTAKAASTLGYLKRLLGPLEKWRDGIESALEGKL